MNHSREAVWDNLKFFLILNVVIGHFILYFLKDSSFCRTLYVFIYSYHMPLFIFIAGYFHHKQNTLSKIYFFVISALLLRFLMFTEYRFLYNKYGSLTLNTESGAPWFMWAMAAFIALSYVVKNINPKIVLPVSIIIGCFVGYDKSINDYLVLSRIIVFFPFYYAGIFVSRSDFFKSQLCLRTNTRKIISVVLLITFLIVCFMFIDRLYFLKMYFNGRYPYSFIWNTDYLTLGSGFIRLLCYGITALMGYALIILVPVCNLPVVSFIGTKTLQIYFWHMFFIQILRKTGIFGFAFRANMILFLLLAVFLTLFLGWSIFSFPVKNIRDGCLKYKTE